MILITGAAGFVGSHLIELLLKEGVAVSQLRLVLLENESTQFLPKIKFNIVRGNIKSIKFVEKITQGVNVIYHLAAITAITSDFSKYKMYEEVNVNGTSNLLAACAKKKIRKFIFFSSVAVYGLPEWKGDIANWNESHPKTYSEVYGKSKLEAENKIIEAHKKWGIPYVIIRPAILYGPRDIKNLLELYRSIKKHLFFFMGNGNNKIDYVFVKDVVRAARLAELSTKKSADYIIAGERHISLNEAINNIAESINTKVFPIHIPKIVGLCTSYIMEYLGKIVGIPSPLFPSRVKIMTSNYYFDTSKAKKELNYVPLTPFKEGTKITAKWLIENKML